MTGLVHRVRDAGLAAISRGTLRARPDGETLVLLQPDHLGDIILSQPAVRLLRERLPDTRIVGVVGPWSRDIAEMAWPVDEIITLKFPGFTRRSSGDPTAPYRQIGRDAETLRSLNPKAGIVLRPEAWWAALVASRAMNGVVAGDDRPYVSRIVAVPEHEHSVVRAATIAAAFLDCSVPSREELSISIPRQLDAANEASGMLKSRGIEGRYAVIHPGSGAAVKLWTDSRWRAIVQRLNSRGLKVVLTGSPSERPRCDLIAEGTDAVAFAGETSVAVLAELFRDAALAVGTDNGPMHLAVAVDAPTVHLFGPSDPERYGPWGDPSRHRVVTAGWHCPRCGDLSPGRPAGCGCMLAISAETVCAEVDRMLDAHGRS